MSAWEGGGTQTGVREEGASCLGHQRLKYGMPPSLSQVHPPLPPPLLLDSRFSYTQEMAFIGLGLPLISPSPLPTTQEIAFIGLGLDGPAIDAALTACLCSDGEMAAAAAGALEDPFVEWPSIEVGRGRGPGGVLEGMFEHRGGSGMGRGQGNPGPDLFVEWPSIVVGRGRGEGRETLGQTCL